ncbi:MAG TPA: histidine kinase [Trebonia sp.]|nr:histidine kinase [Trebonia sp.]
MGASRMASWLWRPAAGLREIGWGDIALAVLLSLWGIGLTSGLIETRAHDGAAAAILVLAMTVPVVAERRAPLAAAAAVAVGAALNELIIGPMVRCGPALPAVFVIAFFAATRLDRRRLAIAIALCLASVAVQAFYDPNLGPSFLVAGVPVTLAAGLAGRLARSRARTAAALRERNAELREQREQTAELAVAADRARVAADLDDFLRDRITAMATAAETGRDLIGVDPDAAKDALAEVESSGRATLAQMREVVGALRQERLTAPQPVLAQLGSLLESATTSDARLQVEGSPRLLPAGLELSAYRIVEHLLAALQDEPGARIDVLVRFRSDALELDVTGPVGRHADPMTAFAVARERIALLGGTLRIDTHPGRWAALVRLPLTADYART